ncbi:MAG: cation:proton antiporter [Synergistetes bacterium]|nr:cation:proton antiporter [Synergistota bacterium]MDW8191717.1 cation:proton antiporter [Synergistota bacterium]
MDILLKIAIILLIAKFCGYLAIRIKLPEAFGALLGGIIIGPMLGIVSFSEDVSLFGNLGVIFLLFLAGLETNFEELKGVGISPFIIAVGGLALSIALGYLIGILYGYPRITALFLGGVLMSSSVGLTTSVLIEMKKLHTKEGTTILASAVIDDILGLIALAIIIAISKSGHIEVREIVILLAEIIAYFTLSYLLGSSLVKGALKIAGRIDVPEALTAVAIALMLIFSYLAEEVKIASITGAYLAGLIISKTPESQRIKDKVYTIAFSIFIPAFLVGVGANTNINSLIKAGSFTIVFFGIAILTKTLGCGIGALITKRFTLEEALKVGLGMIPRMEVSLVVANSALIGKIFDESIFTASITMILLTTIAAPIFLKWAFSRAAQEASLKA